jgi:hypothetical protein
MKMIKGGGVLLETPQEARIAEQLVRELPPTRELKMKEQRTSDSTIMEMISERIAKESAS